MTLITASTPALELDHVSFRRNGKQIVHDVSFTVGRGEHWVMLGPNGAGKSTILSFCGAVTFPTTGTVRVLGKQLGRVELQALRRDIGHVNPRHPLRSPLTITDIVLTGMTGTIERPMRWHASESQRTRAAELIEQLGLTGKAAERWPTLSQGERGRALIARALAADPQLLLLDEPTTGLDVAAREQLLDTIDMLADTRPNLATVLITHHLEDLPASTTHALLLAQGTVVTVGLVEDVLTSQNISNTFSYPITVKRSGGRWVARGSQIA